MPVVVQLVESTIYDGTNAQEVAEWAGGTEVANVAEDGTLTLTVTAWGLTYDIVTGVGWYVLRATGVHHSSLSPEVYAAQFHELPGT